MTGGPISLPRPEATGPGYFDLETVLPRLADGSVVRFPPFELVMFDGLTFCLNFARDPIQNALRQGAFYEADSLAEVARLMPPAAHILDVGANIGSHAVFFATRMQAARVVVVEPNPLALAPLVATIALNRLGDVIDTSVLGIGLGRVSRGDLGMRRHDRNLGATRMRPGAGTLQVHPGDELFQDERFDLIKIDVEGMEMDVLAGLSHTIERSRPVIHIEVDDENLTAFEAWLANSAYTSVWTQRNARRNSNHLIRPAERPDGHAAEGPDHA